MSDSTAFILIAKHQVSASESGTTLNLGSTLDIQYGDFLVAMVTFWGTETSVSVYDTANVNNEFNVEPGDYYSADDHGWLFLAYKINASKNVNATIRVELGAAKTDRSLIVYHFRPIFGSVIKDVGVTYNRNTGTNLVSPEISPDGTNVIIFGAESHSMSANSDYQIGGSEADDFVEGTNEAFWYTQYTSPQTYISATCFLASGGDWVSGIIAFSSSDIDILPNIKNIMGKSAAAIKKIIGKNKFHIAKIF